jgi:hypothetical protein
MLREILDEMSAGSQDGKPLESLLKTDEGSVKILDEYRG